MFGKGKFEIFKLISHSNKDRKKKESVIYLANNVALYLYHILRMP